MAKLLWEWKPRFAVALVVRDLLIVTSHTNCDVTSGSVVMRRYANADGDEQRYKTSKTQVSLTFCKLWSWWSRNWPLIRSVLSWLVLQSGTAHVVPAGAAASGRATAGTNCAVPDCSTNHSSADRIVVNSYNHFSYQTVHIMSLTPDNSFFIDQLVQVGNKT